ncbi:MAG TPA: pitrilysin family protein [Gemmatimonadales bacterium]|jgi:predicted Zn-dependent peptidase|nr:pitrilysin family protein [Gemmatimonadales bacterium]
MRQLWSLLAAVALATPPPVTAQQQPASPGERLPVVKHVLPNGMTFLLLRREGAPTVSFVTHFRAGGVDEWTGISGTAHLFEHMLFKGTRTIGTNNYAAEQALFPRIDAAADSFTAEFRKGALTDSTELERLRIRLKQLEDTARQYVVSNELDHILTENGAVGLNASTGSDATNYYFSLPANRAQLWFILESDRVRDPVLREFYSEREVVMEERRLRVETQPFGMLIEEYLAAAFRAHPYGRPVVGVASEIQAVSRNSALEYFHRYYGPNNAVVAIVGDINVDTMKAWATRYFGDIPPGQPHRPVVTQEPPQRGERRISVEFDANPQLLVGYHVPGLQHPDAPALAVLAQVLTGGRTSRLFRRLVIRDRVATTIGAFQFPGSLYPRMFTFQGVPIAPHSTGEIETAVYEEIDRLQRDPPTDEELQRVRNQAEAGSIQRLQSNFGLAFQLSSSEALWYDWRRTFRDQAALARVTAADVQRVARTYFSPNNRTVATLVRPARPAKGGTN